MLNGRQLVKTGGFVLLAGASSLTFGAWRFESRALELGLTPAHLLWLVPLALALGALKGRFVMRPRMRANAARLLALPGRLWPWQLYPPQLFAFILTMVGGMAWLRRVFAADPLANGLLGGVDLAVAAALLVGAGVYREALRGRRP